MKLFVIAVVVGVSPVVLAQDASHDDEIFGATSVPDAAADDDAAQPDDARAKTPTIDDAAQKRLNGDGTPVNDVRGPTFENPQSDDDRDAAMFGVLQGAESALADKVGVRNDLLAIGGQLFSRYEAYGRKDAPTSISSPHLLDFYGDARPNDRIRVYVRARLEHNINFAQSTTAAQNTSLDPTGISSTNTQSSTSTISSFSVGGAGGRTRETRMLLDQLWLKTDIAQKVFVTAGRQQVRWGPGRFWNPTDFLNTRFRDPLTLFDERLGVGMLRFHIPVESLGWNFYAIALLDNASSASRIGAAGRAEFLLSTTEIALSATARKNEPEQLGVAITSGIGLFDLRCEVAVRHGVNTQYYREQPGAPTDVPNAFGDYTFTRNDDWLVQAMVGGDVSVNYSEDDSLTLGVEGFFNQAGYDDARFIPSQLAFGGYNPLYNGKYYAGAYISLPAPGSWNLSTFSFSALGNLSDGSYQTRLDYSYALHTYVTLNLYASTFYGTSGELNLSLRRTYVAPVQNDDGTVTPTAQLLVVNDPIVQAGAALRVAF